jgi:surface antigen
MLLKLTLLLVATAGIMAFAVPAQGFDRGAFYYGGDCGGNPDTGKPSAAPSAKTPSGVILDGRTASAIGQKMNCDDRRHAIGPYRDGLEGPIGRPYAWFNPEGGGSGSFTPVRGYSQGGYSCRDFREVYDTSGHTASSQGTACLQSDGNWHTQ